MDEKRIPALLLRKQEMHRRWKEGQATWNPYREVIGVSRKEGQGPSGIKSGQGCQRQPEGLIKYISNKRQTKDNVGHYSMEGEPW